MNTPPTKYFKKATTRPAALGEIREWNARTGATSISRIGSKYEPDRFLVIDGLHIVGRHRKLTAALKTWAKHTGNKL